jgi:trehalose 6-phosphate phosphatase
MPRAGGNSSRAPNTIASSVASVSTDHLWAPFRRRPEVSAVTTDFDGTLSPIVTDPATARPLEGTRELLEALAARFAVVAVVSGRPVAFLEPLVPASVVLSGLYGLEAAHGGTSRDESRAERWRGVIEAVASAAETDGPAGMGVERKGLALTLHYRGRPELADAVEGWAAAEAARSGLAVRPARMSVELHPPVQADKGTALLDLVAGLEAVCFCGDDIGDLPAFDALDRLCDDGVHTVRVVVESEETAPELLARADVVVPGPAGTQAVLRGLLD